MRRRKQNRLGALDFRAGPQLGPVRIPWILLAAAGGYGALVFSRFSQARKFEGDGVEEYERPGTGPCSKIEDQLNTPVGCGTVGVTGYRRDPNLTSRVKAYQIQLTELPGYPGFYLQSAPVNVAAGFMRLRAAAKEAGFNIALNSAFRTMGKQQALYKKFQKVGKPVTAYPGTSPHQMGLAVDVAGTAGGTTPLYRWLVANCAKFGFHRTVPSESWHYHYKVETDPHVQLAEK